MPESPSDSMQHSGSLPNDGARTRPSGICEGAFCVKAISSHEQPAKSTSSRRGDTSVTTTDTISTFRGSASIQAEGQHPSMPHDVFWQWEHKSGFRNYLPKDNYKIECAYRCGDSKVRLKTGKQGCTPMEIFFADMIQYDAITGNKRSVRRKGPQSAFGRARRYVMEFVRAWETGQPRRQTFQKYVSRQEALAQEVEKYDVTKLYHADGYAAKIARSNYFAAATLTLVCLNVLWIGVDVDRNPGSTISDAPLGFRLVEYFFCVCFTLELFIRFLAFKVKWRCLRDEWFCFDTVLVFLMALETFLLPLAQAIVGSSGSSDVFSHVTILRMARILKLARTTRLLRAQPQLMTMLRGIVLALRSVFFTFVLQAILVYVFGIFVCTWTQSGGYPLVKPYFSSLPRSMFSLLVHGTFLDSPSNLLNDMIDSQSPTLLFCFLGFIILSSFTLLNMLIGILFQVVEHVSEAEKLKNETHYLRYGLLGILECYDKDGDETIGKDEFAVLMKNPEVHDVLNKFGTDVHDMVTLADVLFDDTTAASEAGQLSFEELIQVVLRLRGARAASVTDIVQLREYLRQCIERLKVELLAGQRILLQNVISRGEVSPTAASAAEQPAAGRPTVVLHLELAGRTRSQLRSRSLTVAELLLQARGEGGPLRAVDSAGVLEIGPELLLGDLADPATGEVSLRLLPDDALSP